MRWKNRDPWPIGFQGPFLLAVERQKRNNPEVQIIHNMAEPPKTPTKAATRICRTCNENIVVKNHPLDLFGAKASQENIPSVLERFFELKVALNDGLPSYICVAFSKQQQESVLRVKRGKTMAESPSGRSMQTRRDLKEEQNLRRRTCYRAPQIAFSDAHGQTFENSTTANISCTFIRTRRDKKKAYKES